jgi:translin
MSLSNVRASLDEINNELKNIEERREKLLKGTRDVISLCSKCIVDIHYNNKNEGQQKILKAREMLDEFRIYAKVDLHKYIAVAEQEFVEAFSLMSIVENSILPGIEDVKVSGSSYAMGLLDCVGELKRMVYDRIRSGRAHEAAKLFAIMEEIYSLIYPFAIYDNVIAGLRRKLDVAKILIEDIRAVITEESRRENMIKAIEHLETHLGKS